jgi:hypothetical protein
MFISSNFSLKIALIKYTSTWSDIVKLELLQGNKLLI